jgi:hypothetical protein
MRKTTARYAPDLQMIMSYDSFHALKGGLAPVQCFEAIGRRPATARRNNCRSSRAGRFDAVLFARCAGVHVDFHAHRHFDDLRGLPAHSILPRSLALKFGANSTPRLSLRPRRTPRKCGTSNVEHLRARPERRYFSPGQSGFSLGQIRRRAGTAVSRWLS